MNRSTVAMVVRTDAILDSNEVRYRREVHRSQINRICFPLSLSLSLYSKMMTLSYTANVKG